MKRFGNSLPGTTLIITASLFVLVGNSAELWGQAAGSFAGTRNRRAPVDGVDEPHLSVKEAKGFIVVKAVAEVRVEPAEIRLVMAVISGGKTAGECKKNAASVVTSLRAKWMGVGIETDSVFEDFISIIPVYKYVDQKKDELTILQEVLDGYRYQTNLHLKLPSEAVAHQALDVAYGENVTDIIAFDYWHPGLEKIKIQAMKKAIGVARAKAAILLDSELFPTRPKLINIRESSKTIFPIEMYQSFNNDVSQSITLPYRLRNDVARISAARPKTTFYRGPLIEGDSLSPELPMKPEISVVSSVRLFFEVPKHGEK